MKPAIAHLMWVRTILCHKMLLLLRAARVHQYVKNTLIFVPLLTGHLYENLTLVTHCICAFIAFCGMASSVYLLNDIVDLEADKQHRSKRHRPLAAGELSLNTAILLIAVLFVGSIRIAITLNPAFIGLLLSYFLVAQIYTFYIKKTRYLDVFFLACFYVLRILAGIAALDAEYSLWLLGFSWFFFLSLALLKRYSELYFLKLDHKDKAIGRGYSIKHLNTLLLLGTSSGLASLILLCGYHLSDKARILYQNLPCLWLNNLLLTYWLLRFWRLASQGQVEEDLQAFLLKDKISLIVLTMVIITWWLAI